RKTFSNRSEFVGQSLRRQITQPRRRLGLAVHGEKPHLRKCVEQFLNAGVGQFAARLLKPPQRGKGQLWEASLAQQNLVSRWHSGKACTFVRLELFEHLLRKKFEGVVQRQRSSCH